MAKSVNTVIISGTLGQDLELKATSTGKKTVQFSIAENIGSGDSAQTYWHTIEAWEKTAELIAQYCKKGNHVLFEGSLKQNVYTDKEGIKRYATSVVAREFTNLTPKKNEEAAV